MKNYFKRFALMVVVAFGFLAVMFGVLWGAGWVIAKFGFAGGFGLVVLGACAIAAACPDEMPPL